MRKTKTQKRKTLNALRLKEAIRQAASAPVQLLPQPAVQARQ
jgi:hypothetical protein